jgi:hypothetical protein
MLSFYPEQFERDMGCTVADWLRWLPAALGEHPCNMSDGAARVQLADGALQLNWRVEAPLRIALVRMPRLHVAFIFTGLDDVARHSFMTRFDLYLQRGGG